MKSMAMRFLCAALVALFLAGGIALAQAPAPATAPGMDWAHMTIKVNKLTDNFYTIEGVNGIGRTGGTIGVLTGPDGIFMVDASYAPLTDKIIAAIRTFSNAPIRFMVNTHVHPDHVGGNANLAKMGTTILARPELRAGLVAQKTFDVIGLPVITYTAPVTFHMDGEEIVLTPVPPAHTDGDTMVYFRNADVLMIGDFFRTSYPNIGGTIDGMISALGMAAATCGPNTKVIPGHGIVSSRADILAQRDLIVTIRDRIANLIKQGKTEDEVVAAHPTADYDTTILKDVTHYYDAGTLVRNGTPENFVRQLYEGLKPKA